MDFSETLTAVLVGNFLTVMVLYVLWRLRRDDGWATITLGLAVFAVIGVIGWSAKPTSTGQTYQSVVDGRGD